jgi:hypothetical protein
MILRNFTLIRIYTNTTDRHIPIDGKYLGEFVKYGDLVKLYLWQDSFYEVWHTYGDDEINSVEKLEDESHIDLFIQVNNRTGTLAICECDKDEKLREVGRTVKAVLKRDHPEFLNKLYWDEKLNWFCEVIEIRAAYLVDEIKKEGMLVTEAREVAINKLMGNPQSHMKPPYIKKGEEGVIWFPDWFMNRRSMANLLIEDQCAYGDGISQVLSQLDEFGGWEDDTNADNLYKSKNTI